MMTKRNYQLQNGFLFRHYSLSTARRRLLCVAGFLSLQMIFGFWFLNFANPDERTSTKETLTHILLRDLGVGKILRKKCWSTRVTNKVKCPNSAAIKNDMVSNKSWSEESFGIVYYYHDIQNELYQLSAPNKLEYCKRHKYVCFDGTKAAMKGEGVVRMRTKRQEVLQFKHVSILTAMERHPGVSWFLFLDMDTIIMNMDLSLAELLNKGRIKNNEKLFLVGTFERFFDSLNAGVFFIRNSAQGKKFVMEWQKKFNSKFNDEQQAFNSMFNQISNQELAVNGNDTNTCRIDETDHSHPSSIKFCSKYSHCVPSLQAAEMCAIAPFAGVGPRMKGSILPNFRQLYLPGDFAVHLAGRFNKLERMRKVAKGQRFFN